MMAVRTSFYTREELEEIGFAKLGQNVLISRKASIYSPELMEIGDNVRIDDFCIISGKIRLGNYIHIASGCYLFAGEYGIEMENFSGLSSRVTIYAVTDDYSGKYLTNPTVPEEYRNVIGGKVHIGKHVIIGTGSTVLPGVEIGEGAAIGAMSLVTKSIQPWKIAVGIPAKEIRERSRDLLELEQQFLKGRSDAK
ncbi:galactoside O-acetyltransferase [Fervidobacterium changbaicum]|nr:MULTISPECIES: acyltransferase [Fervidobacterium]SDH78534.1 galactoside O-acetyltransferase [Fervidobacterium changbaicum]